jgi:hypothetical protein
MQSWEILPLKVGNIMGLRTSQCSGSKTNVMCGELARSTWFWLDIIIVFRFGMSAIDASHGAPVYLKLFSDGIIGQAIVFEMDNPGLFGG